MYAQNSPQSFVGGASLQTPLREFTALTHTPRISSGERNRFAVQERRGEDFAGPQQQFDGPVAVNMLPKGPAC